MSEDNTISLKDTSDYYTKDIKYDIYSKDKDIDIIKDIDISKPYMFYYGNRSNFTSIHSILSFIAGYYPNRIIVNSDNEIMIKFNDSKYAIIEFHTFSVESDDDIVGLKASSDYPYDSNVYKILNPRHNGLKLIRTRNNYVNYNEFFPVISKAIVQLLDLHPSEVNYYDTVKMATNEVYNLYNSRYCTPLENINLFSSNKFVLDNSVIKKRLELLKSQMIESNAEYIIGHPNPFVSSAHKTIRLNKTCVSVLSFMIDRI